MSPWVKDPHSGGVKIPPAVQERVKQRILNYAAANYAGKYTRLGIRFRSQFCYVDAYTEPDVPLDFPFKELRVSREEYLEQRRNTPLHLCRLRYFSDEEAWTLGFYAYSSEKYEPCMFPNGSFYGTPEEAFAISSMYLE
ncbi:MULTISPECIES: hypothetical protein [unclassified Microcoleus]|uniref:hypothetical protein n=1 Tax=unclassified Microcoleus TaxID=2642155 RepID=UPI001D995A3D|nr:MULTISPECIES: hypothetical protein [unclassified Microcoleus]MCC3592476.1 hypothetical protein [Microcoleus sp. PH2017_28_MFU_U_A]MCC3619368.1 hypothetical protein [Microcoleus sp. PH2017_38_RDM_U_B]